MLMKWCVMILCICVLTEESCSYALIGSSHKNHYEPLGAMIDDCPKKKLMGIDPHLVAGLAQTKIDETRSLDILPLEISLPASQVEEPQKEFSEKVSKRKDPGIIKGRKESAMLFLGFILGILTVGYVVVLLLCSDGIRCLKDISWHTKFVLTIVYPLIVGLGYCLFALVWVVKWIYGYIVSLYNTCFPHKIDVPVVLPVKEPPCDPSD